MRCIACILARRPSLEFVRFELRCMTWTFRRKAESEYQIQLASSEHEGLLPAWHEILSIRPVGSARVRYLHRPKNFGETSLDRR